MRICPKCRKFSDDELLRFCLKDGVPLISVNLSDKLWSEGQESIRETRRTEKREVRKQQLKKVVSTIITTVIIISIFIVITTNSWIYLAESIPQKEPEIVKNIEEAPKPSPSPETKQIPEIVVESQSPTPTEIKNDRPTQNPTPKPLETKSQTPKPTASVKPTAEPTKTKTIVIKPSPNAVAITPVCNTASESAEIKRGYSSYFLNQIKGMQPSLARQYMRKENQAVFVGVTLNNFSLSVSSDCKFATAIHIYQVILINRNGSRTPIDLSKSFSCSKNTNWSCK
jgi:outer membrane biosynthesis protein TonB